MRFSTLPRLGFHLTAFAFVRLESQAEPDLLAFEARARQWDIVREAYALRRYGLSLKCVAPDLVTFQNFIIRELSRSAECKFREDCLHHQNGKKRAGCRHRINDIRRERPAVKSSGRQQ